MESADTTARRPPSTPVPSRREPSPYLRFSEAVRRRVYEKLSDIGQGPGCVGYHVTNHIMI